MSQRTIDVRLTVVDEEDVLLFCIDEEHPETYSVNLNSPTGQHELKNVFSGLLQLLFVNDISLNLIISEGYKKGLYKDVCREYINDLNRELIQVKESMKKELL